MKCWDKSWKITHGISSSIANNLEKEEKNTTNFSGIYYAYTILCFFFCFYEYFLYLFLLLCSFLKNKEWINESHLKRKIDQNEKNEALTMCLFILCGFHWKAEEKTHWAPNRWIHRNQTTATVTMASIFFNSTFLFNFIQIKWPWPHGLSLSQAIW